MTEPFQPLDPDRQLGYLLARVADGVSRRWHDALRQRGVSPRQFSVLALLVDDPGLSQGELARRVLITPQSMSELLRGLIDAGLVERGPVRPGRAASLVVTDDGRRLLVAAYPVVREVDREAFGALDGRERSALEALLRKLLPPA